jgi:hypothetical protein
VAGLERRSLAGESESLPDSLPSSSESESPRWAMMMVAIPTLPSIIISICLARVTLAGRSGSPVGFLDFASSVKTVFFFIAVLAPVCQPVVTDRNLLLVSPGLTSSGGLRLRGGFMLRRLTLRISTAPLLSPWHSSEWAPSPLPATYQIEYTHTRSLYISAENLPFSLQVLRLQASVALGERTVAGEWYGRGTNI